MAPRIAAWDEDNADPDDDANLGLSGVNTGLSDERLQMDVHQMGNIDTEQLTPTHP